MDPISNLAKQSTTDVTDTVMLAGSEVIKQTLLKEAIAKELQQQNLFISTLKCVLQEDLETGWYFM